MSESPTPYSKPARYGIGEWYGKLLMSLSPEARIAFARKGGNRPETEPCPHRAASQPSAQCSKAGGVCSIRLYERAGARVLPSLASPDLVTVCPSRFWEDNRIFRWIGQTILGDNAPVVIKEVGFLKTDATAGKRKDVGKIDTILVAEGKEALAWCAVELQAVYFSGTKMEVEFPPFLSCEGKIPFPVAIRRPDYRSSGPKRLMPQLQTKVPTLRRWGIKTAVVVDRSFYRRFAPSATETDLTNADIAWFVVAYDDSGRLRRHGVHYATLEETVVGLTAGVPTTKTQFENELRQCLQNPKKCFRSL